VPGVIWPFTTTGSVISMGGSGGRGAARLAGVAPFTTLYSGATRTGLRENSGSSPTENTMGLVNPSFVSSRSCRGPTAASGAMVT